MTSDLTIEPLTPFVGAEIAGVDLRVATKEHVADIRAALLKHQVVFFRDQTLNQEEHIHFARQFGELEIHPATPKGQNNPEVLQIAHGPESRGRENMWPVSYTHLTLPTN